jgi:hypothetical protein
MPYVQTSGTGYAVTQGRIPENWVTQETTASQMKTRKSKGKETAASTEKRRNRQL